MSVSPIAANIYVNQAASAASNVQGDTQAKTQFANVINSEAAKEVKEEIAEIRPTEETYKIDPENEHEKQKNEQNEQNKRDKNEDEEEEILESSSGEDEIGLRLDLEV